MRPHNYECFLQNYLSILKKGFLVEETLFLLTYKIKLRLSED